MVKKKTFSAKAVRNLKSQKQKVATKWRKAVKQISKLKQQLKKTETALKASKKKEVAKKSAMKQAIAAIESKFDKVFAKTRESFR